MQKHINIINSLIRGIYIEIKNDSLIYWKNHSDPESRHHLGINKEQEIERAKEILTEARAATIEDIKQDKDYCLILKIAMRRLYLEACDFSENPYIKISNLKRVIILRAWLNEQEPNYIIYSNRYIMNIKH